ncbi:unnamed protein product [Ambrosiozyma monospora]|uniref:Unnamed protein product n=1 Tax=Ambrosiozyma monospora TaxID=43982 RepID=A0ACB5T4C9_AMBMO|nr:unnamed protein product [Ambrosiozyma monospora]
MFLSSEFDFSMSKIDESSGIFASQPFTNQVSQECGIIGEWFIEEAKFLEPSRMKDGKMARWQDVGHQPIKHSLQAERYLLNLTIELLRIDFNVCRGVVVKFN